MDDSISNENENYIDENNRKAENTVKNSAVGLTMQIIFLIFAFVSRTVFIYLLGNSYLSVSGLFSNILEVLNLSELGFGTAMAYNLYSAVSKKDTNLIKALVKFYKKIYIMIGTTIIIFGLLIMPFITYLISGSLEIDSNIYIIFGLYILQTASTYFFSYRASLIVANQKKRVVDFWTYTFKILTEIFCILVLLLYKNFYLYLIIRIIFNVLLYVFLYFKAGKMYNYLNSDLKYTLTKTQKKKIYADVFAVMLYKVGGILLNETDSIIVSISVSTLTVGILSNYTLITSALKNILYKIVQGYTASLGIQNAKETEEKKYKTFKMLRIVIFWAYGFVSIGMYLVINKIVYAWIGSDYLLANNVILAIVIYFYLEGCDHVMSTYRTTTGLFKINKYYPLVAAIINLFFSFLLGYKWGVFGVLISTSIARILTYFWIDPHSVYKRTFKRNMFPYFFYYIVFLLLTVLNCYICYLTINSTFSANIIYWLADIFSFSNSYNIIEIIIDIIFITIISNIIYLLFFLPQKDFRILSNKIFKLFKKNHFKKMRKSKS